VVFSGIICAFSRTQSQVNPMKAETHPNYDPIKATCSCGNVIETKSTICNDISIEVCSQCHPFYTGKQKTIDSAGRIDRFNKRFRRGGSSS
jgi:large subunit ribosomal protein L31